MNSPIDSSYAAYAIRELDRSIARVERLAEKLGQLVGHIEQREREYPTRERVAVRSADKAKWEEAEFRRVSDAAYRIALKARSALPPEEDKP